MVSAGTEGEKLKRKRLHQPFGFVCQSKIELLVESKRRIAQSVNHYLRRCLSHTIHDQVIHGWNEMYSYFSMKTFVET